EPNMSPSEVEPDASSENLCIAHVNAEKGFSGGERQLFLLMEGLRKNGTRNLLLCKPGGRAEAHAIERGFETLAVPMANDFDLRGIWKLFRALRRLRPHLVHLHTGRATWLGGIAAKLVGIPAITTRRMDRTVKTNWRNRFIYNSLVERAVAISPAVASCLRRGEVPDEKIVLIYSSIDPTENRALFLPASLDRRKGIDILLEALRILALRPQALTPSLWIAGAGPEEAALRAQIEECQLQDQVSLLGQRDDVPDLLQACDIFVLPSRREGLGIAALEAMAAGKPVIASRVGGLGQAVLNEVTGILVNPEDPEVLADAIERLAHDPVLRQRMGDAGPARIRETFLAEGMVRSYEQLYARVLQGT
ncbi:MAG: glycosyltransferase, partial [Deltaproteobacteria bacterium]|nr:glycosyltransferase [Deltaproteobacteria bacterium]